MSATAVRGRAEPVEHGLSARVMERKDDPGAWSVEVIDPAGDQSRCITVFHGPRARERAFEYARLKYGAR